MLSFGTRILLMALLFYLEFMSAFIAPAVIFSIFMSMVQSFCTTYIYPLPTYVVGQLLIGTCDGS